MPQLGQDMVGAQVAQLGASLLERADELAEGMVEHIYEAVPVYRSGAVDAKTGIACLPKPAAQLDKLAG